MSLFDAFTAVSASDWMQFSRIPNSTDYLLYNRSNVTSDDSNKSNFDFVLNQIIVPILFSIISLVGVVGNSLVIYVILSNQTMRTVTNILLLNLAFADLSFALVVPPPTAYLFVTSKWPFGNVACKLMHYLVNVTAYVTVYTLVIISAIRYMTVVHNVKTALIRTRRNVVILIIGVWIVMLALNTPIFYSYGTGAHGEFVEDCDHYNDEIGKRIFSTFFVFAYLLPLAVIGIFSICILRHISRNRASMALAAKKSTKKSEHKKKQASLLLVLVVVLFAIFWLPVHLHLLFAFFGTLPDNDFYSAVTVLCYCLAYFNSCVNPIIYNRTSKDFRDAFKAAVMGCCKMEAGADQGHNRAMTGPAVNKRHLEEIEHGKDGGRSRKKDLMIKISKTTETSCSTDVVPSKESQMCSTDGVLMKESQFYSAESVPLKESQICSADGEMLKESQMRSTDGDQLKESELYSADGAQLKESQITPADGVPSKESRMCSADDVPVKESQICSADGVPVKESQICSADGVPSKEFQMCEADGAPLNVSQMYSADGVSVKEFQM